MKKRQWRKYTFEFLSIFIAVISAFALNNWNENKRDNLAENRILTEIKNGLIKDLDDVKLNILGHKVGLNANEFWRSIISGEQQEDIQDTLVINNYYFNFLRDFISIQNSSGYENLKSRGLELIKNDLLRSNIISLYEYDYAALKSIEEEYFEMQFYENYFKEINNHIAPNFIFDSEGKILSIDLPLKIDPKNKNILLSYIWKLNKNRKFALKMYESLEVKINSLKEQIEQEIE